MLCLRALHCLGSVPDKTPLLHVHAKRQLWNCFESGHEDTRCVVACSPTVRSDSERISEAP